MNLVVVFGGRSSEHSVSIKSAENVLRQADQAKYRVFAAYIDYNGLWSVLPLSAAFRPDELMAKLTDLAGLPPMVAWQRAALDPSQTVVFPALHGRGGEDGSIQGLFELLGLPYVGCGVTSSALGMDKVIMKRLAQSLQIPVAPFVSLSRTDYALAKPKLVGQVENLLHYPCFVKPANGGSSIGITRVGKLGELLPALRTAFLHDDKLLIEREIVGREIEIGLLGNEQVSCSPPGEFLREPAFFDFRCKYLDDGLTMRIPAVVPEQALQAMLRYSTAIYQEFGCSGLCRADFFLTAGGEVYFNEINTMPGFTEFSMYPSQWAAAGLGMTALIDRLVELALAKRQPSVGQAERSAGNA